MDFNETSRRSFLKALGAGAAAAAVPAEALAAPAAQAPAAAPLSPSAQKQADTRAGRMKWWHEAKFGMFIHWGLYSVIGQHEWAKEFEGIPIPQYEIPAPTPPASGQGSPSERARSTWS